MADEADRNQHHATPVIDAPTRRLLAKSLQTLLAEAQVWFEGSERDVGARILDVVAEQGSARPSDIAARVELHPSTVSRRIHELLRQGYLAAKRDAWDRRAFDVHLTEAGRAAVEEGEKDFARWMELTLEGWDAHQAALFARDLHRFAAGWQNRRLIDRHTERERRSPLNVPE